MLLEFAEANACNTSGARGRRLLAPFGEEPESTPIMCSASIESIGLRIFSKRWPAIRLKALALHILSSRQPLLVLKASPYINHVI